MSKLCSKKKEADLTRENLQRGEWKEMQFKGHNFSAKGLPVEVVIYIHCSRFEEMPRNNYVGSSFSNLMYFINRNNTLPVINITPSFHEVKQKPRPPAQGKSTARRPQTASFLHCKPLPTHRTPPTTPPPTYYIPNALTTTLRQLVSVRPPQPLVFAPHTPAIAPPSKTGTISDLHHPRPTPSTTYIPTSSAPAIHDLHHLRPAPPPTCATYYLHHPSPLLYHSASVFIATGPAASLITHSSLLYHFASVFIGTISGLHSSADFIGLIS